MADFKEAIEHVIAALDKRSRGLTTQMLLEAEVLEGEQLQAILAQVQAPESLA
jgi:hypothetical protein